MEDSGTNKMPRGSYLFPAITGTILILVILILTIYFPEPTDEQYQVFRIVLALACGGFSALIPGLFEFRYKSIIQGSGAIGVFCFIYLINPSGAEIKFFDFTIFVENEDGDSVLKGEGVIVLKLGSDKREEEIDKDGSVNFKNIPISYRMKKVQLTLEAKGWEFINKKKTSKIKLKGNSGTMVIAKDNSFCCLSGDVRSESNEFLPDVLVRIGSVSVKTNQSGFFQLELPKQDQKEKQKLSAFKNGFFIWEQYVYPGTEAKVGIILLKK